MGGRTGVTQSSSTPTSVQLQASEETLDLLILGQLSNFFRLIHSSVFPDMLRFVCFEMLVACKWNVKRK